jgi:hypothetical protein
LTKALVLLVTVLSIVLVALVVPFVAQTDDYQSDIDDLQTQLAGAQAAAQQETAARLKLEQQLTQGQTELQNANAALMSDLQDKSREVEQLRGQLQESSIKVDSLGASLNVLTNSQEQLTALLKDRTSALSESQSGNVNLKKENAQLAQRNDELDTQVQSLTRQVRTLNEKIVDLQETGGGTGGATASSDPRPTFSGEEIRGAVTGVRSVNDITLVQLNVGASDAVSPNTQFVIFRNGNEYVGTATVKSVDETVSVARVDSARGSVQAGDGVITATR